MKPNKPNNNRPPIKKVPIPKNPDPNSNIRTQGREGMRLIKNIAFGTFNFGKDAEMFRNPDFVNATILEVNKRLVDASLHIQGMRYAYAGNTNPDVLRLIDKDQRTYDAYAMIRQTLDSIILSNYDVGMLYALINKLPQYKYNI